MQLEYIVREPAAAESELPLSIIVFHGYGANEHDLVPIASALSKSAKIISLRGPIELPWGGYAWYHLEQTPQGLRSDTASRLESEVIIIGSLPEIIRKERIDPSNIILMGFSQGTAMCYSLLSRNDFAAVGISLKAVVALSGYVPQDIITPLSKKDLHGLPVFISHGEFDEVIPFSALAESSKYLAEAQAVVTSRHYPIGHGINDEVLSDLKKWFSSNISWK
ncbi:MAG TPA: dienelactone hydrolase family protein [Candidatus Kapabacteria bacterium]|nr:dienelactone hydrolase family protein [Candidatus Kapabacteria bacterium]